LLVLMFSLVLPPIASLAGGPDRDKDGVPDKDEIEVYSTDPDEPDTDGDGYSDWQELNHGYSPHNPEPVRLQANDADRDGLSDRRELDFGSDILDPDTDGDGYSDGREIKNGYDPLARKPKKLPKRIEVDTADQELSHFLGGVKMGTFPISSGKPGMHTPTGHFRVDGKNKRAWSSYGLWMPWWMSLQNGYFGIHELPEWPDGTKEGTNSLGQPVSHGCIRLGVGPAELLYHWTPVGTPVFIY